MDIDIIIDRIRTLADCVVLPPTSIPVISPSHLLHADLLNFYRACGGIDLFVPSAFPTRISSPAEFVLANPVIFSGVPQEYLEETREDPSWSWYIIAYGPNAQYITVDLNPSRQGLYYNSVWIKHPGNSEVIAHSLQELLEGLLSTQGKYYWFD